MIMDKREGAGLPCLWFCYLWHNYVPGSHTQAANVMLASCARCGRIEPRDPVKRERVCKGVVRIELRA